jgi:hypothetical protein
MKIAATPPRYRQSLPPMLMPSLWRQSESDHPAAIQPKVPKTRMGPKSRSASLRCENARLLVREIVGA